MIMSDVKLKVFNCSEVKYIDFVAMSNPSVLDRMKISNSAELEGDVI